MFGVRKRTFDYKDSNFQLAGFAHTKKKYNINVQKILLIPTAKLPCNFFCYATDLNSKLRKKLNGCAIKRGLKIRHGSQRCRHIQISFPYDIRITQY